MSNMIEIDAKDLEYVLTNALLAIQGVALSDDKKERIKDSIQGFLKAMPTREVRGHKTPLNLNPVV